jgi:lysine 2,3-aminomutase
MVGDPGGEYQFNTNQWQEAIDYIARTPAIRDVLLSGGDPLVLSDDRLQWLLERLSRIPHVEFLRIGSKVPFVLPQRITPSLVNMLKQYHPLWMSVHVNHPTELTPEAAEACNRLADAGIPLGSQTVLLRGVNDDLETMRKLFHGLLRLRVKPYYLFQADLVVGTAHFRTPLETGLEIMRGLRGFTTGYAVPQFAIDLPGGGGKTPMLPEYDLGREGDTLIMRNYEGDVYRVPLGITTP